MIITVACTKGGVGKSTVAVSLISAANRAGIRVRALDIDPQGTLNTWLGSEVAPLRPDLATAAEIAAFDVPGGVLIVDTPAGSAPQSAAGWEAADVLVAVTGPTSMDVEGLSNLVTILNGDFSQIDFVVVNKFHGGKSMSHAVFNLISAKWGADQVVLYPDRAEVPKAFDGRREIAERSEIAIAAGDLLARILKSKGGL
jgi:cellulose biosynthesis protein BcsQ